MNLISLRIFVRDGIIKTQPAANGVRDSLTTEEIIESYTDDCSNVKRWVPIAAARAELQLPDLMGEFFGVTKSHASPETVGQDAAIGTFDLFKPRPAKCQGKADSHQLNPSNSYAV